VKNKIRLMNKIEQTIIMVAPKYMVGEVVSVYREKNTGIINGKMKTTNTPVIYDKVSNVWRLAS